ncbi:unnamed protein product [Enterobius vermicularis]|uniref:Dihydroorotate dehydrogenase (quinone), mitochondrial n=1 Tax=Enterobius vermicularis TaxID=51028 RepID=A0A0N4V0D0_ENTVE|nr:unnamed protein product [Enterobius vermicularis]
MGLDGGSKFSSLKLLKVKSFVAFKLILSLQLVPCIHQVFGCEKAHRLALAAAKYGFLPLKSPNYSEYEELECKVFGRTFKNPIGLAAGFDKNGVAIKNLRKSGFGFVEIGSVTPLPQKGNPAPRIYRLLEDEAVINRCGFNNAGVGRVLTNVKKFSTVGSSVPLGVNLGKNKDSEDPGTDYEIGVNYFGPFVDYLVVNLSSPNTPGLRDLQKGRNLKKVSPFTVAFKKQLIKEKRPAILLKISPDLLESEKKEIAKVVMDKKYGVDGLIVTNTTISRPEGLKSSFQSENGGLSGKPLRELSTKCVSDMYKLTGGKVPIIGCGGVSSGEDAYEKIRAGASLVQLYTGLVYQGFPIIGKVKRELVELLRENGYKTVSEAVGVDHKQ